MGSFANTVFSVLLGWMQGLISIIWSALTGKGGESFFEFIGNNWIKIAVILCAAGLIIDFAVYFFRWEPYKVWRTFFRHLKGRKGSAPEDDAEAETVRDYFGEEAAGGYFRNKTDAEEPGNARRRRNTAAEAYTEERYDDLSRWERTEQPEEPRTEVPAETTKAGYSVPIDSPYRRPENRNRRRHLRLNLLGDDGGDEEIHYFAPRPMMDQKEAYHTPVYPEQWKGDRERDS